MQMAFLASARSAIFFHCSSLGSTPEGLCATLSTACLCQNRVACALAVTLLRCYAVLLKHLVRSIAYTCLHPCRCQECGCPTWHMTPRARGPKGASETRDKTCHKTRACGGVQERHATRHATRHVRVEDEDRALLGLAEVLEHAVEIETHRLLRAGAMCADQSTSMSRHQ